MSKITVDRALLEQALEALENCTSEHGHRCNRCDSEVDEGGRVVTALRAALEQEEQEPQEKRLWLWKNFVDGKPEYWAFDNAFPTYLDCDDPQTLGEPCGYALFKPSRQGRNDVSDAEVLLRIKKVALEQEEQEPVEIKPPNPEGATQCIVRWMAETHAGWVGAWDREALQQFVAPPRRECSCEASPLQTEISLLKELGEKVHRLLRRAQGEKES